MTIEEVIATLYAEIVSYQKKAAKYDYDDQTRRANREELRVLDAKISVCKKVIKLLQTMEDKPC